MNPTLDRRTLLVASASLGALAGCTGFGDASPSDVQTPARRSIVPQPSTSEILYVDVPGARLGYQVIGGGSGKPAALMIHGYSGRSTGPGYASLYRHLSDRFTIYALDTRGHGASAAFIDGWTLDLMAADVASAVQALGLARPVHVGHSYGGFLGLLTELRHPGTFSTLNLLAPAAASGGAATPEEIQATMIAKGRDREVMKLFFGAMYVDAPGQAEMDIVVEGAALVDPKVHEAYFRREYANINITSELPKLKLPVLSVTGARDVVVAPSEQRATTSGLPNAKEVMFSDEGHMLPLEEPLRAAREVIRFAEDLE